MLAGGALLAQGPAGAQDPAFPKRRAGLWEVRTVSAQASGLAPTRFCVGDQTDRADGHLDRSVGSRGACTLGAFQRAGDMVIPGMGTLNMVDGSFRAEPPPRFTPLPQQGKP